MSSSEHHSDCNGPRGYYSQPQDSGQVMVDRFYANQRRDKLNALRSKYPDAQADTHNIRCAIDPAVATPNLQRHQWRVIGERTKVGSDPSVSNNSIGGHVEEDYDNRHSDNPNNLKYIIPTTFSHSKASFKALRTPIRFQNALHPDTHQVTRCPLHHFPSHISNIKQTTNQLPLSRTAYN
ncbi:hypothetical protein DL95DRAFT_405726 [Leptodontidium sp. 2 PMI_412]|nr:hypothetical protein DL95DRAFT_405726 [Leptodontidium sp. 2 PMI_412]